MNNCTFVGRLVKDLTPRTVKGREGDMSVVDVDIAVNTGYGDNKKTTYVRMTRWGKAAENDSKYLKKGSLVCMRGAVEVESHEYNGKTYVQLVCRGDLDYLSAGAGNQTPAQTQAAPAGNTTPNYEATPAAPAAGNDDLPF